MINVIKTIEHVVKKCKFKVYWNDLDEDILHLDGITDEIHSFKNVVKAGGLHESKEMEKKFPSALNKKQRYETLSKETRSTQTTQISCRN